MTRSPTPALSLLRMDLADALRAGRARLEVSQRELAALTGCSQSVIARLETEAGDPRLSLAVAVLAAVGASLAIPGADRMTPLPWAHVRDRAWRRLPAHLKPYRLRIPHDWWPGTTRILMWPDAPTWSYWRRPFPFDDLEEPTQLTSDQPTGDQARPG